MRRFVDTPTAQMVLGVVNTVANGRVNALITGPAGMGKTEVLKEAARRDKRAAMITATPAEKSLRAVLSLVLEVFDLSAFQDSDTALMAAALRHELPNRAARGRAGPLPHL